MDSETKHLKSEQLTVEDLKDFEKHAGDWIVPRRIDMRLIYLLSIIGSWVGLILFGFDNFGSAEWQTGRIQTYFDLSFADTVWVWFIPFLVYSSVSMLLLLWHADRFSRFWFVRLGIYTSVILTLQFTVQMMFSGDLSAGLFIGAMCIVPLFMLNWFIGWLIEFVKENRTEDYFWKVIGGVSALVIFAFIGSILFGFGGGIPVVLVIGPLAAGVALAPVWACLTAYKLISQIEMYQAKHVAIKAISGAGWTAAYGASAYIAIDRVFELYTQLPTEAPQCYVATASAKGHRRFVNSSVVEMGNGELLLVTKQLQVLKAGELVLRETVPSLHRGMRRVYDSVGPNLASRIQNRWAADLGYLLFKPFEWVTLFLLKRILPNQFGKVRRFYTGR